jgi:hypothetical protein
MTAQPSLLPGRKPTHRLVIFQVPFRTAHVAILPGHGQSGQHSKKPLAFEQRGATHTI